MKGFVTDCDCYLGDIAPLNMHVPSEADIFGAHSTLIAGDGGIPRPIDRLSWVESYAYEGVVIAIFILFCYLLYHFRSDILQVFRFLTTPVSSEKIYAERKLFPKRFMNLTTLLGFMLICGLIIRLCDCYGVDKTLPVSKILNVNLIPVILLLISVVVLLYRYLTVGLVGTVTRNQAFFKNYRFMSRLSGSASFLILAPFFLLSAFGEGVGTTLLIYLTITIAATLYLLYLGKSYRFFVERNVPILQWILYLCVVEWFPISLLLLEAVRAT